MSDTQNEPIDDRVEKLVERWDSVYIAAYSDRVEVRNVTDEGLPVGRNERHAVGESLSEAVDKALKGEVRVRER